MIPQSRVTTMGTDKYTKGTFHLKYLSDMTDLEWAFTAKGSSFKKELKKMHGTGATID